MSYIYIGQYYHKFDETAPIPTDKKIGISVDVSKREQALNSTNLTLGLVMVKYWNVGVDKYKAVERALHNCFADNRYPGTEFFRDDDDALISKVSQLMQAFGCSEVLPAPTTSVGEKRAIEEARVESTRDVSLLVGETFFTNRCEATISVECKTGGEFVTSIDGVVFGTFNTLNQAFYRGLVKANDDNCAGQMATSCNVWVTKNAAGKTPDEVCAAKQPQK